MAPWGNLLGEAVAPQTFPRTLPSSIATANSSPRTPRFGCSPEKEACDLKTFKSICKGFKKKKKKQKLKLEGGNPFAWAGSVPPALPSGPHGGTDETAVS